MKKLKPCKCRGSEKVWVVGPVLGYNEGFCVRCEDCKKQTPLFLDKKAAIDYWNVWQK